jgi:hypothetical protein
VGEHGERYERAFEAYLRLMRLTCLPIEESRRTFVSQQALKSLDFIVRAPGGQLLLIDVKGRRIPQRRRNLECWATRDDIDSLDRWERSFGAHAMALLVFIYHLPAANGAIHLAESFCHLDRCYGCVAVALGEYRRYMRPRSPKWQTVDVPASIFRQVARPFSHFVQRSGHELPD